ncbi:hypothetical protein VP01_1489g1 [Puccinia sorghi]|uniref:Uncharacterized protein n=1 Tax=Puccinia sorghi TaxID=27349 RepID=A0A0L6VK14_9BASI|nr:hypothetical protein VP01_1489g1 [Puccinia sorghi]
MEHLGDSNCWMRYADSEAVKLGLLQLVWGGSCLPKEFYLMFLFFYRPIQPKHPILLTIIIMIHYLVEKDGDNFCVYHQDQSMITRLQGWVTWIQCRAETSCNVSGVLISPCSGCSKAFPSFRVFWGLEYSEDPIFVWELLYSGLISSQSLFKFYIFLYLIIFIVHGFLSVKSGHKIHYKYIYQQWAATLNYDFCPLLPVSIAATATLTASAAILFFFLHSCKSFQVMPSWCVVYFQTNRFSLRNSVAIKSLTVSVTQLKLRCPALADQGIELMTKSLSQSSGQSIASYPHSSFLFFLFFSFHPQVELAKTSVQWLYPGFFSYLNHPTSPFHLLRSRPPPPPAAPLPFLLTATAILVPLPRYPAPLLPPPLPSSCCPATLPPYCPPTAATLIPLPCYPPSLPHKPAPSYPPLLPLLTNCYPPSHQPPTTATLIPLPPLVTATTCYPPSLPCKPKQSYPPLQPSLTDHLLPFFSSAKKNCYHTNMRRYFIFFFFFFFFF